MSDLHFPQILTERLFITVLGPEKANLVSNYYIENQEHLAPWEPEREPNFHSIESWEKRLKDHQTDFLDKKAVHLFALDQEQNEIIAACAFTNIAYGPFMACYLGYTVAKIFEGKGFMHEALKAGIDFMFNQYKLHRIMATYIPSIIRSENVLKRLGCEREGYARSYLKIAGRWQDHMLSSLINYDV